MFTVGQIISNKWSDEEKGEKGGGEYQVTEPLSETKCIARCKSDWKQKTGDHKYAGGMKGSLVEMTYSPENDNYDVVLIPE
ncbi:MAG: hypothetical protein M3R04_00255 [bacterium]|nr:hypothetical protein [bacterium]